MNFELSKANRTAAKQWEHLRCVYWHKLKIFFFRFVRRIPFIYLWNDDRCFCDKFLCKRKKGDETEWKRRREFCHGDLKTTNKWSQSIERWSQKFHLICIIRMKWRCIVLKCIYIIYLRAATTDESDMSIVLLILLRCWQNIDTNSFEFLLSDCVRVHNKWFESNHFGRSAHQFPQEGSTNIHTYAKFDIYSMISAEIH